LTIVVAGAQRFAGVGFVWNQGVAIVATMEGRVIEKSVESMGYEGF
jgi:hypothetical protein